MERPRCAYCGEIVGSYEGARVLMADGTELKGSFLTLGEKLELPGSVALHARCYDLHEQRPARSPR